MSGSLGGISYAGSSAYMPMIEAAAQTYGVPTSLLYSVIGQESSFNPNETTGNASGIAQFMPETAAQYGVDTSSPSSSITGAANYLSDLFTQTGSWAGAVTAYGTVPSDQSNLTAGQQNVLNMAQAADGTTGATGSGTTGSGTTGSGTTGSGIVGQATTWLNGAALRVGVGLLAMIFIILGLASLVFGKTAKEVVTIATGVRLGGK